MVGRMTGERCGANVPRKPRRSYLLVAASITLLGISAACTSPASSASSSAPPTIASDSPWYGGFAAVVLPPPVNSLDDVACANPARCVAVGSTVGTGGAPNGAAIVTTSSGGASWRAAAVPATVTYLSGVACIDMRHCVAVGQSGPVGAGQGTAVTTSDAGFSWSVQAVPNGIGDVTAVSCLSDGRCTALATGPTGEVALVSGGGGSAWTVSGSLPAGTTAATSLSCVDDQRCWGTAQTVVDADHAAGQVVLTTDGGAQWHSVAIPSGIGLLEGVSCETTTVPPPDGRNRGTSTNGVDCVVVGGTNRTLDAVRSGQGVVLTSGNGGGSWTDQSVSGFVALLTGVSCTGPGACIAVGSSVAALPKAGIAIVTGNPSGAPDSSWKDTALVSLPQPLTAVSCVSSSACVAVGESVSEHLATS